MHLSRLDQAYSETFLAGTCGSADAMRVDFGLRWQFIVEHRIEIIDVQAARRDVCCYEHARTSIGESNQNFVALVLIEIAVQGETNDALSFEIVRYFGAIDLGIAEYEIQCSAPFANRTYQIGTAVFACDFTPVLRDARCLLIAGDINNNCVPLHPVADGSDCFRIGGAEQQRLPLSRDVFQDRVQLVGKSHVEHAIGFVEH